MFCILLFTCSSSGQLNTNIRNEIVPLHSTRSDVEKIATLVGNIGSNYEYETKNEIFSVYYALERCVWHGWNVKPDTVVSYTVYPKKPVEFDVVKKNLGQLIKTSDDTGIAYFTEVIGGVEYQVDETLNLIRSITYTPSENDSNLRCKGFPKYNPAADGYEKYDSYNIEKPSAWDIGLVGGLLGVVGRSIGFKGYIFVYGKRGEKVTTQKLKRKIENFAYKIYKSNPQNLKVVFGGFRDKIEIELYLLPSKYPPPVAQPKYPSNR